MDIPTRVACPGANVRTSADARNDRFALALAAMLLVAACSGNAEPVVGPGVITPKTDTVTVTVTDTAPDTVTDTVTATDTAPDTAPDLELELEPAPDTAAVPDTVPDTAPDTAPEPDTAPAPDTAPVPDTAPEPDTAPAPDTGPACTAAQCDDKNPCTTDLCFPSSGCLNSPNKQACNDGNKCNGSDTCAAGTCVAGTKKLLCADANLCTDDACEPKKGCVFTPNSAPCDDGDKCTDKDACNKGACKGVAGCKDVLPATIGKSPCSLDGNLPQPSAIKLEPWFVAVTSGMQATDLTHLGDGTNRVAVVDRRGYIEVFKNDRYTKKKTRILDIKTKVSTYGEGGLLSVAFHPNYKKNGRFYVNYTKTGVFSTVISRFVSDPQTGVAKSSAEQKLLIIKQPYGNHDGGQVLFDAASMLLIGMGDGGSGGDPHNAGQKDATLLGKMLRIDVNSAAGGKPYGIPVDNPQLVMAHAAGWLPEVYAKGLRNPWRFSRDRLTGKVWLADVGQNAYEEVDILVAGANYGWRLMEGNHCYEPFNCNKAGLVLPIDEYGHSIGRSITGGYVYRGKANPQLYGAYIFADYTSGRFFALRKVGGKYQRTQLIDTGLKPVSFGEDENGELYATMLGGTRVVRITQGGGGGGGGGATTFPLVLSATKCFTDLAKLQPAAGLLAYDVNAPLWSDGASKHRYIVLPKGKGKGSKAMKLANNDTDTWQLPDGTILIKHFGLGLKNLGPNNQNAGGQRKVETRFMHKEAGKGWAFYSYLWRHDGKDADLVLDGAVRTFDLPGGGKQTWHVPSVGECETCHKSPNGADLLGVLSAQLGRKNSYGGAVVEQLEAWHFAGLLSGYKGANKHSKFVDQHALHQSTLGNLSSKALNEHARTYLHVQCADCHRPGGNSNTDLDLRYGVALAQTKGCNVAPKKGAVGVVNGAIIKPGKAAQSTLWVRMGLAPKHGDFMPEIGVAARHDAGVALVKAWIGALKGCQ